MFCKAGNYFVVVVILCEVFHTNLRVLVLKVTAAGREKAGKVKYRTLDNTHFGKDSWK